jgi:iron complex outermembrane receptor protein
MITTRRHYTLRRAITLALVAGASSAVSVTALAAEPEQLETVIVTGSHIRRADIDTAAPVQVVTREDIDRTGKTTLAEYLQTLTADGQGSVPKSFGTGFSPGGAGVSLRGLGASSTLVLLNGRRIAPYGLADDGQKIYTDISVIPLEAVERVEVLKDGASAIYGSDAIAGVVNIILRNEYRGASGKATLAASEEGDGEMAKLSFTGGFGDLNADDYNIYFNLEGAKTESISVRDRADRKWIGSGDLRPYGFSPPGSQFMSGYRTGNGTSSQPGNVLNPTTGLYESLPGCAQLSPLPQQNPEQGCVWDSGEYRFLTPEQKYVNFFTHGAFAVSDTMQAYAELGYSHKESYFENTPSGVSGSWGYPGGPVNASSGPGATVLGPTHPDNPFPGQSVRVRYLAWDVGPRTGEATNDFWRVLAGLRGNFGDWDFDAAIMHSESDLTYDRDGFLRYSAVRSALLGTGPVVWRIGDNANLNSQAVYDAISPKISSDGASKMDLIDAKVSRGLMDLPGGELGFAFGVEYRKLETSLTPQTYTDIGDIIGLGYSAYEGTQEGSGAYVEVLAPVLSSLELSAALRYDYYAGGLDATTPKFGVKWSPIDMLTLRGTYAEGFRVPNPAENGDGGLAAFTTTRDPVRCPGGTPLPGATQQDCSQSVALIVTPNPELDPEESESYTVGLVFTPFDATTLTVDFWEIKRTNEINTETIQDAIARGATVRSDNLLNGVPGTGSLLAARANYVNSASTTVQGVDVAARQTFDLAAFGQLRLDAQWTHTNKFDRIEQDGTTHKFAGTHGDCSVTNCIGTPEDRVNFGVTLEQQSWSIGAVVNFRGEMDNTEEESSDSCFNTLADGTDSPSGCTIKSFYSVDLSGRWRPTDSLEVFGSVENALDRVAPLDPHTYGAVNYNPLDAAGAIGRYFTLGLSFTF